MIGLMFYIKFYPINLMVLAINDYSPCYCFQYHIIMYTISRKT